MPTIGVTARYWLKDGRPALLVADTDDGVKALRAGDYATALKILEPLAEEGNHGAKYSLGEMYREGRGLEKSFEKAAKLYREAADGNYPYPQRRLGSLYFLGQGVGRDLKRAYMWYEIAASLGDDGSAGRRDQVASNMTPADIAEAKKLASDWFDDHPYFRR